jgi:hypothetical protein
MRGRLSGAAWLAIISTITCLVTVAAIVMMLGFLSPGDLVQLGRLAQ